MNKMSFKEYFNSKEQLKKAGIENIRANLEYSVTKYCKILVVESMESEKIYISLKPSDKIQILWEYESDTPILKKLVICNEGEKEFIPCWTSNKIHEWCMSNCTNSKPIY